MATHHSRTKGTKGTNAQIVVPSWDNIWASFEENNEKTTVEAMNADGWKTVDQVIETIGLSKSRIYNMIREGKMERVKKKVTVNGLTNKINFIRPKL